MTTVLYLIRHGETDWNVTKRWQGHADVPLNARGMEQSRHLARYCHDTGMQFTAIYSSDLTRAYQTAWELGALLKVAVQLWPPLREMDVGTWSGLTRDEIRAQHPIDYRLLEEGQDIPRGGGETASALSRRIVETVEAMVGQHPGGKLALVTHGGCIRSLVRHALDISGDAPPPKEHIGNTSMTIIEYHAADDWRLVQHNGMEHLRANQLTSVPPDDAERV